MAKKTKKIWGRNETQSFEKLFKYFFSIEKTKDFQEKIDDLRKKYKIPPRGFISTKEDEGIKIPKNWELKNDKKSLRSLRSSLSELSIENSLDPKNWLATLQSYLFYNLITLQGFQKIGLIMCSDDINKNTTIEREYYPIILRISPYATRRDMEDYIRKMYSQEIKPLQKKYKNKKISIGKIKKRSYFIEERNNFIYENRYLPRKQIMSLVADKFGKILDYGHIGKIISLEKKRRKEV